MKRAAVALAFAAGACGSPCLDEDPDEAHVRVDDPAQSLAGFVSHPFPSDALVTPTRLTLRHFPNPTDSTTLADYLEVFSSSTDGFGTSSALYVGFSSPIDPASLPADPMAATAADASVFLVDVDVDSNERGRRIPLSLRYGAEPTLYLDAHHLVLLPPYGITLRGDTTYALLVTERVKTADGEGLAPSKNARNAMYAECEASAPERIFAAFAPLRDFFEDSSEVDVADVAAATVFTTQGAVSELRELAAVARTLPAPQPAEWRQDFVGTVWRYDAVIDLPGFQEGKIPYEAIGDGGALARNEAGAYYVTHQERTRVGFAVPRGPTPPSGWPVVLYSHGTGGSFESLFNGGVAEALAAHGIASVSYDQTLHGPRAPAGTNPEITFFNLFNPVAARDNIRQGAADAVVLTTMIRNTIIPASVAQEGAVRFDPDRIAFLGHSQGGLVGAGFAAVDERIRAFVFSGLGAILTITLQERKDIVDFELLLGTLLSLPEGEELDDFHPVLNLIQTFIDRADPIAYAKSYLLDPPALANRDFLQVEGFLDFASPARGQEAFAVAARFPVVPPTHRIPDAAALIGPDPAEGEAIENVDTPAGPVTAGLIQYPNETHFPIFDNDDARRRYLEFLDAALLEGRGRIVEGAR